MTFNEILEQVIALLQRQKRVAYGALKRRFNLDDAYLEDLKDELIYARHVAIDEDNRVLVWTGTSSLLPETISVSAQPPAPHADAPQVESLLAERFPETAETQPELLAHHYTEAGLAAQAIPYWLQAGQRAIQRSAHAEAIAHLSKGLEVLKTLPDTPDRVEQELSLQVALG
jgi:hypothetical protein